MPPPPPSSTLFPYTTLFRSKRLLDPHGILNPDVVLSEDPQIHLKHLKPLPAADEIVDKCIECGFCEPRSEEHTSELQSQFHLVCRLLLEKKKQQKRIRPDGS